MFHLTRSGFSNSASPLMCKPNISEYNCIPLIYWNGKREDVCPECLEKADRIQPKSSEIDELNRIMEETEL